jgi:hypothetical protein
MQITPTGEGISQYTSVFIVQFFFASGNYVCPSRRVSIFDSAEKVASLKWLQICQNTNDIFDRR